MRWESISHDSPPAVGKSRLCYALWRSVRKKTGAFSSFTPAFSTFFRQRISHSLHVVCNYLYHQSLSSDMIQNLPHPAWRQEALCVRNPRPSLWRNYNHTPPHKHLNNNISDRICILQHNTPSSRVRDFDAQLPDILELTPAQRDDQRYLNNTDGVSFVGYPYVFLASFSFDLHEPRHGCETEVYNSHAKKHKLPDMNS